MRSNQLAFFVCLGALVPTASAEPLQLTPVTKPAPTTNPAPNEFRAAEADLDAFFDAADPILKQLTIIINRLDSGINYNDFHKKIDDLRDEYAAVQQRLQSIRGTEVLNVDLAATVGTVTQIDAVWKHANRTNAAADIAKSEIVEGVLKDAHEDQVLLRAMLIERAKDKSSFIFWLKQKRESAPKAK